jgi:hypothetical protein
VVFGQHVRLILILVTFFFWGCLKEKVYSSNAQTEEELTIIFVGKLQTFLQNSFRGQIGPPPVRGMSTCRGTAFSTPSVICEL